MEYIIYNNNQLTTERYKNKKKTMKIFVLFSSGDNGKECTWLSIQ